MFWHGCNYPWSTDGTTIYYGLDFGANVWGSHLGISTRRAAVASDFRDMAALGFTVVRWFVFADGRAGIVYDDAGIPVGLDPHFFADLDTAFEVAGMVGIQLHLVLLDHRWMFEGVRETIADAATGALLEARLPDGRAHVLHTSRGRTALLDRVIAPVVRRYAREGARPDLAQWLFGFELMNEPDFVVEEWERDRSSHVRRPLSFPILADMVRQLSDLVHSTGTASVTIGCARTHNLWAWDDPELGLDWLQLHSYPDERHPARDVDIYGRPAASLRMTRPVVLGEFPGNGPMQHPRGATPPATTLDDYLEFAVQNGWAGAWPWSFSGTDGYGRLPVEPLYRFARRYPELVNPRALAQSREVE